MEADQHLTAPSMTKAVNSEDHAALLWDNQPGDGLPRGGGP